MYNGLCGRHKARTDLHSLRAEHERRRKSPAVRDTACSDHRDLHRVRHLRHERHGRERADVPAALHSLRDDCIRASALHQLRHRDTRHDGDDLHACPLPHLHIPGGISGSGRNDLDTLIDDHLRDRIRLGIHQHDVDAEGSVCRLFYLPDLLPDKFCRSTACTDDPQSAGF